MRLQPRLITFLVIAAFLGMTSEGWDRLAEANFLYNFQFPDFGGFKPVVWLGAIGIVLGGSAGGTRRSNSERSAANSRIRLRRGLDMRNGAFGFYDHNRRHSA